MTRTCGGVLKIWFRLRCWCVFILFYLFYQGLCDKPLFFCCFVFCRHRITTPHRYTFFLSNHFRQSCTPCTCIWQTIPWSKTAPGRDLERERDTEHEEGNWTAREFVMFLIYSFYASKPRLHANKMNIRIIWSFSWCGFGWSDRTSFCGSCAHASADEHSTWHNTARVVEYISVGEGVIQTREGILNIGEALV